MDDLLDRHFLESIGVSLDDATYRLFSAHYETTLHARVIAQVLTQLDAERTEELHALMNGSDASVRDWLVANIPELDAIIEEEIVILLGEVADDADAIQNAT